MPLKFAHLIKTLKLIYNNIEPHYIMHIRALSSTHHIMHVAIMLSPTHHIMHVIYIEPHSPPAERSSAHMSYQM